ncbi:transglycosylase SLT domain-containing protein [Halolactibacillus sp. JCM 19043]|uniref:transglycosylase SLT domain-containing protein n=1 Tax=Halolactibacillus sp. JCM 19043 TaxID=1460638 RepID=UPI0007867EC2|nr:transglycosylase SLT domain-containing protein [Halolactibacillus sp. JCM 19043]
MTKRYVVLVSALIFVILLSSINLLNINEQTVQAEEKTFIASDKSQRRIDEETSAYEKDTSDVQSVVWQTIEKDAETMMNDSEGRFKKSWAVYMIKEARKYEIDPFIVYELLKVETGHTFAPDTVGPETIYGHAYGMAQFMENTAPWIAEMAGVAYEKSMLFDPYYSMKLSVVYLDYLYEKYGRWMKL